MSDTISGDQPPDSSAPGPLRDVPVDWEALEDAFENNAPEVHSYLHLTTGEVLRVVDGVADPTMHVRIASDGTYLRIDPVSSREQYRWMERFIPMVDAGELRDRLTQAIDGKGAFRRFKDVLMSFAPERERWFVFRSERLRTFMEAWSTAHAIKPVARPEWQDENPSAPESEGAPDSTDEVPRSQGGRRARTAEMLRQQLKESRRDSRPPRPRCRREFRRVSQGSACGTRLRAPSGARHARACCHRGCASGRRCSRIGGGQIGVVSVSRRRALVALTAMVVVSAWEPGRAKAGETSGSVRVDRVVATIYAPEMGGAAHPHFVFERLLAFEARVVALLDRGDAGTASIEERDVREAFDHFVAGEILSVLATKVQGDSWGEEGVGAAQLEETVRYVTEAATERAGGRARLDDAARIRACRIE